MVYNFTNCWQYALSIIGVCTQGGLMKTLKIISTSILLVSLVGVSGSVSAGLVESVVNGTANTVDAAAKGAANVVGAAAHGTARTVDTVVSGGHRYYHHRHDRHYRHHVRHYRR